MDYQATREYSLPIELMMENAGYHLARLTRECLAGKGNRIMIGVGNGNNGGGGLVAARRLAGWGYEVGIETFAEIDKALPKLQLERALKFGAQVSSLENYDAYIDAFLGFSQRPPLPTELVKKLSAVNKNKALKIALDIPTGVGLEKENAFKPDIILTIAAMKEVLTPFINSTKIFIADIGIPKALYNFYGIEQPEFY